MSSGSTPVRAPMAPSRPTREGWVVEFVGRAGVGKTTVARACEARLRELGVPVFEVLGWRIPASRRLQPRNVLAALRMAATLRVPRSRRAIGLAIALYKELAKISYARTMPGVVVFDQGLFQKLDSLRRLCPPLDGREAGLVRALRGARLPDLLVEVVAEPATLAQRLIAHRAVKTSEAIERAWLSSSTTVGDVERLRSGRAEDARPEYLVVRNEEPGDVEAVAERMARHIAVAWDARHASVSSSALHPDAGKSFVSSRGS